MWPVERAALGTRPVEGDEAGPLLGFSLFGGRWAETAVMAP